MRSLLIGGALAFAVAGVVAAPGALQPAMAQEVKTVALTGPIVEAFIKSYPAISAQAEIVAKKYNVSARSKADTWEAWTMAPQAWPAMNGTASAAGYSNFREWLSVALSVNVAYQITKFLPSIAAVGRGLDNNPGVAPITKANAMAVAPYMGQLDKILVYVGF